MKHTKTEVSVSVPQLGLIAATRGLLGGGLGLLIASRLQKQQRKTIGWTLFLVGVFSTIPLMMEVFGGEKKEKEKHEKHKDGKHKEPHKESHKETKEDKH